MSVYTQLSTADIQQVLDAFGAGSLQLMAPIAEGIENSNYRVDTEQGSFVLTVYERDRHQTVSDVLSLVACLADRAVPVPRPLAVRGHADRFVLGGAEKPISLSPWVEGVSESSPDEEQLEAIGAVLAQLHCTAADLPHDPPGLHRPDQLFPQALALAAEVQPVRPSLAELLRAEVNVQEGCEPLDVPQGFIHGDLFLDNILFQSNGKIAALLDFFLAGKGPWMYDLAVILLDACWGSEGVIGDRARALLRGYRSRRSIRGAEYRAIPILLRRVALRFLCLRLQRFGLDTIQSAAGVWKDPLELERKLLLLGGGQPLEG